MKREDVEQFGEWAISELEDIEKETDPKVKAERLRLLEEYLKSYKEIDLTEEEGE